MLNDAVGFEKIFQSVGKMKVTMFSMMAGSITNIILDPLLIFGLTWILSKSISCSYFVENVPIESKGLFGKAMDSCFFIKD